MGYRLVFRHQAKDDARIVDEVPDHSRLALTGEPLTGSSGLQTQNNPGWPGFGSDGGCTAARSPSTSCSERGVIDVVSREMRLVLGTRKSALALAQSRAFARALEAKVAGLAVEELHVVTSGDKTQASNQPLVDVGGKGLFIKELEEALLDGRAHFAVHSIKDVPAVIAPGCVLACVPRREDPRDVLVSARARRSKLPPGARGRHLEPAPRARDSGRAP